MTAEGEHIMPVKTNARMHYGCIIACCLTAALLLFHFITNLQQVPLLRLFGNEPAHRHQVCPPVVKDNVTEHNMVPYSLANRID
jgi:hypothetical protein